MSKKGAFIAVFILLAFAGLYYYFQMDYLPIDFTFVLGLVFAPYIIRGSEKAGGHRYAMVALMGLSLLLLVRNSSLYFFSIACCLLYVLEKWRGRLNNLPLVLILLLSPLFRQVLNNWSFPIRLCLSEGAAYVLGEMGYEAFAEGNIIILSGVEYAVDPACAGLKMLGTAMLLSLMVLAYRERERAAPLNIWQIGPAMLLTLLLAVAANFTRLLALVLFHILPEHPMHDIIGLFSLIVYVLLPFYWLSGYLWPPKPAKEAKRVGQGSAFSPFSKAVLGLLLVMAVLSGRQFLEVVPEKDAKLAVLRPEGFEARLTKDGVLQLEDADALVYIKPAVPPWQGSHDPRICWRGSGYTFSKIKKVDWEGIGMYTAVLTKGADRIYGAWWYVSEEEVTVNEWQWRWKSFWEGRKYRLINVNTYEEAKLREIISRMQRLEL